MSKDPLGDKFKELEKEFRQVLPHDKFYILRLDGKAFHTFTKQFKRPMDWSFMLLMDSTAEHVMREVIQEVMFGYVQSDEISIIFRASQGDTVFGGRVEKILSVAASAATAGFMEKYDSIYTLGLPIIKKFPMFDARIIAVDSLEDVQEYMDWRRLDARKNAVSMIVSSKHSHSFLQGKSLQERKELLTGTDYEHIPNMFYNGRFIYKSTVPTDVTFTRKDTQETITKRVPKTVWRAIPAFRDFVTEYINNFKEVD